MTEGRVLAPPWPALVLRVCDMFYVSGPACATGPTLVALTRGRAAVVAFVDDRGPVGPGLTGRCVILRVA